MTRSLALLFICLAWSAVFADVDDAAPIYGTWRINRVVVDRTELQVDGAIKMQLQGPNEEGLIVGYLRGLNSHTLLFKAEGHRLIASCGSSATTLCTSTLLGRIHRKIDASGKVSVEAVQDSNSIDDDALAKLFATNEAYWTKTDSGIAIGLISADTRLELSPWNTKFPSGR